MKHYDESCTNHVNHCFKPFISPNPITSFNPIQISPTIDKSAFVSPFTSVIGDVVLRKNVYVAPLVSIRADEGTPFYIGSNTNLQDGVILHGLLNKLVEVKGKDYSIYISKDVSVAHGALIHGPCYIGKKVFVGFKTIVYDAIVESGVFIANNAVVTNGVHIAKNRFVPPGAYIDSQKKADSLSRVPADNKEFAREVQRVNQEFPAAYNLLFGDSRCSCGMAYNNSPE
ncbi:carbonate dehydratase [Fictibacillus barbaricus]|uniref:Carbon dioxide concentrating mechanism protein CcmM n=1 Tax=Fictibacillus barbaricus TaxID=182136 RepID=A0ABU1TZ34_9BACL|nr:carbonate dehydratase [Fictibacillus barbaricus]MDR7072476.1 carbon dioxide concentrating mechanism protein CcmM [Fictibacillus barbaricus]